MSDPTRVLVALGRLQDEVASTPVQPLVDELVAAIAADTTAVELRQEVEFLKAESNGPWSRRIDPKNVCTCDRDCPRHGDVSF